jgi:hypothetical protein
MGYIVEVDFYNSYMLKRIQPEFRGSGGVNSRNVAVFPGQGLPGGLNTDSSPAGGNYSSRDFYIEESRIRGGYNNTATDNGARAYLDEQYPLQQNRNSTLIYSGIYNSRTGINQTNVFSVGEAITKSLDPVYGSIQKTYSEDTNLIVFQENKIHRALIDKDTIYTTESGTQTQAGANVIGQFVAYKGEYGISKNPESFAIYNYRKYFSDKNRNAIMRLSNDGLTEISMYGMQDYFRDNLADVSDSLTTQSISTDHSSGGTLGTAKVVVTSTIALTPGMTISGQPGNVVFLEVSGTTYTVYNSAAFTSALSGTVTFNYKTKGKVIGGWDIHNKNYVVSLQKNSNQVSTDESTYKTLSFDERINGWVSLFTYKPNLIFSTLNKFYSIQDYKLYEHYHENVADDTRGSFYGVRKPSNVTIVFNTQPNITKNFNTIFYEGSNGWEVESFNSGFTGQDPNPSGAAGSYVQNNDSIVSIKSYDEGSYVDANTGYTLRAGFDRKENRYVANLRNNSAAATGEILFGAQMSGIKGYFATVKIETDETTQLGGPKEIWAAGTNFVLSSY